MWQQWVNAILGLWIILSAFLGMSSDAMVTNLVIVGIIVAILGFWGAARASSMSGQRSMNHQM